MPNLTEKQWDALTAKHLKTVINDLALKQWSHLQPDEQEALGLVGLTEAAWNSLNQSDRKKFLTEKQWTALPARHLEDVFTGLVGKQWSVLTADEQEALGLSDEKQWNPLTTEQRKAIVRYMLISDVLTAPKQGQELPPHRKWTLPQPDNKALDPKP